MAKAAIPVQILAIVGGATLLAGAHSLLVPISIARESKGFVLPEGPAQNPKAGEGAPEGELGETPETPVVEGDSDEAAASAQQSSAGTSGELEDGKIDLATAAALHERIGMGVWFLDARRRVDFDTARIEGALFMEHTHLSSGEGLDEILSYSPPEIEELLVIYCTGGDCQASEDTAILLEQAGYTNIAIMAAGFDEWKDAGLPTAEGP